MESETFSVTFEMRPIPDFLSQVLDLFPTSSTDVSSLDVALADNNLFGNFVTNETNVKVRKERESKKYICPICHKIFKRASNLVGHERFHSDERKFACSSCPKRFKVKGDLKRHWRIHSGARPFTCSYPGCEKSFTTSDIRKGHEMIHKNQRNFKCSFEGCTKNFMNKRNLVNHENIHSQTKPYSCKTCQKRFIEYSAWYKHSRVHRTEEDEIERVHKCRYCHKSYKNRCFLVKHVKGCHESEDESHDLPLLEEPDKILNDIRIQICVPINSESD